MKDEKLLTAARGILERYLKDHGLRRTPERFALLERVFSTGDHFYHVSRSTVYATMQLFFDAGLVRRHQFGNQPAQYERAVPGDTRSHLHLLCTVCGRVREVRDQALMESVQTRPYVNFRPQSCAVYVYGICRRCQRRKDTARQQ